VRAHRVLRDEQPLGDLVRSEVLVEEEQHLDLASGQHSRDLFGNAAQPTAVAHTIEESSRDSTREGCISARDAAEERGDLFGRLGLEQVARCTRSDRGEEVLLGIRRREDDDLGVGRVLTELRQGRKAVHARHGQVEEHEIGTELGCGGDRGCAVLRFADDVETLLDEECRKRVARQRMVVHDEDAFRHLPLIGRRRRADK